MDYDRPAEWVSFSVTVSIAPFFSDKGVIITEESVISVAFEVTATPSVEKAGGRL